MKKETETLCGGIVLIDGNKVLLVRHTEKSNHKTGHYGIPSGQLKDGESFEECALRKLENETGLKAKSSSLKALPDTYSAKIKRKRDGTRFFSMKVFKCKKFSGKLKGTSVENPEWVEISKIDKIKLLPNMKRIIKDSLKKEKSMVCPNCKSTNIGFNIQLGGSNMGGGDHFYCKDCEYGRNKFVVFDEIEKNMKQKNK